MNIYRLPKRFISLFRITVVLTVFAMVFGPAGMAYAQAVDAPAPTPPASDTSTSITSGTTPASSDASAPPAGDSSSETDTSTPENSPATPPGQPDISTDSAGGTTQDATPGNSDGTKGKSSTTGSNGSKSTQVAQPMTPGFTNNGQPSPVPYATQDSRPSVQGNNGSLTYSFPFVLPKGINGLTPDLALQYDNNKREEGSQVGFGWTVTIPKISRLNKTGVENMYTDNFFSSTFDDELVVIGTSGATTTYAARSDDGSFRRYQRGPTIWTMTTKEGLVYTFGTLDEAQDVQSAGNVATWYLSSITDTHGITISYRYVKDNRCVPAQDRLRARGWRTWV